MIVSKIITCKIDGTDLKHFQNFVFMSLQKRVNLQQIKIILRILLITFTLFQEPPY